MMQWKLRFVEGRPDSKVTANEVTKLGLSKGQPGSSPALGNQTQGTAEAQHDWATFKKHKAKRPFRSDL